MPMLLLSSAVIPPNFSNRSAIRFRIFWSAGVSPEGRNRYQGADCSLSAFSTSSSVGNPFIGPPVAFHSATPQNYNRLRSPEDSVADEQIVSFLEDDLPGPIRHCDSSGAMLDYILFVDNSDMIGQNGQVVEHQNGIKLHCLAEPNKRRISIPRGARQLSRTPLLDRDPLE